MPEKCPAIFAEACAVKFSRLEAKLDKLNRKVSWLYGVISASAFFIGLIAGKEIFK